MGRSERPGAVGLLRWCVGAEPRGPNRRGSRRFPAVAESALLEWAEGGEVVTTPAALMDVSLSGFSALTDVALPVASAVWVSLGDPNEAHRVRAVVVDARKVRRLLNYRKVQYRLRLRFRLGCPYTFFRAAVGAGSPAAAVGTADGAE